MDVQALEKMLAATLDDERVTRGEKGALSAVLDEADLSDAVLAKLRSRAFDLARRRAGASDRALFDWLEAINKLLAPRRAPAPAGMAEAYFTPTDSCLARIRSTLAGVERTADICVFTITDNRITDEILAAHRRGVRVRIISDNDKADDRGSDVDRISDKGVPVKLDRTEHHMHHKFAVFDRRILLTGSYNWTRSAEAYNHENIVLTDDRRLVTKFIAAFDALWDRL